MRLIPRVEKISHPNPVVTWATLTWAASPQASGLMVDELTGVVTTRRGRCGLASCELPAAEEIAPHFEMCAEHAALFNHYHAEGRPVLHPEVPTWY